jgi:hypothetical protein
MVGFNGCLLRIKFNTFEKKNGVFLCFKVDFLSVKYPHIFKYLINLYFFKYGFKCEGE